MELKQDTNEVVELGTPSSDTLGNPVGKPAETIGFYPLGISDE